MPHDTDHKPARPLGLSPAQIAGSALSAVSAAFVASWAGTTGTLIGAAVGSVIATIGAALYTSSLRRSSEAVRRAASQVRQTSRITSTLPRTTTDARPQESVVLPGTTPENFPENSPGTTSWRHRLPWGKVLLASLAVTVAALGGITVVEAITGRPISSYLGHDSSQGTTVGHVIGSDSSTPKNTGTDKTDKGGPPRHDATTPSQDAQPSTPPDPQPPVPPVQPAQPSGAPSQAPVLPPDPEPSTAP